MTYRRGDSLRFTPAPAALVSGVALVQYQVRQADGTLGGPILTGVQSSANQIQPAGYPETPAISIGTAAGQAGGVSMASSGAIQHSSGAGLPTTAPADPTSTATYESLDLDAFFKWDTDSRAWRSMGQLTEDLVVASLPAATWTRMPDTSLLSTIEDWKVYRADGSEVALMSSRRATDGWPELHSQNAYSNLQIQAFGSVTITP